MTRRTDYCPIGNEPCQSLCETPCTARKPMTDEQKHRLNPYNDSGSSRVIWLNGFAAAERAHGIVADTSAAEKCFGIAPAGGIGGEL